MLNKKVSEVMAKGNDIPKVKQDDFFRKALEQMNSKKLGGVAIVNDSDELVGLITDGDVKRLMLNSSDPLPKLFLDYSKDIMIKNPASIPAHMTVRKALELMQSKSIWCMPVVDNKKLVGFFQMKSLLDELVSDPDFKK